MDLEELRYAGGGWSYVQGIWANGHLLRTGSEPL